ncbi:hypothetical protein Q4E93_07585 [Flavitalea sp. BT771]|uniref:hypothetical protein n=1 Tax=Flavitalea sp. BT771 TaxID=3063329 RepID=UPI0026E3612A|nr:hypothetical protein [Flavitalea sp. BT771]MDO6430442.1 hypothetical protein [Flavitalea sp. BT771]MDV6219418.1 hypothetical protein [Flavitalea sp. BT771]
MQKILLILLLAAALAACKKNHDKQFSCRLTALHAPSGLATFLSYNNEGKLVLEESGRSINTYTYEGASVTITTYDTGLISRKTIVLNNTAGLAANVRVEFGSDGANWSNTYHEYEGDEVIRSITTFPSNPPDTVTYLWSGHNLVGQVRDGDTTRFEYYTDKPRQDGDYLYLSQFLSGYEVYRTKNLFKGYVGATFIYDFTSDGKIAALKVPTLGTIYSCEYQCK